MHYRLYEDCSGMPYTKEEGKITANLSNRCQNYDYKPLEIPLNKNYEEFCILTVSNISFGPSTQNFAHSVCCNP